jgi:2-amino-4-hydroxy-6-hydroxymethyldihydropteridine diphosphokinase
VIETVSDGSTGPNFLNAAAAFCTIKSTEELKYGFLRNLESSLGRIRTSDKNSPRTIDLDITVIDQIVIDPNIWIRVYLAVPLAELFPTLIEEKSGLSILEISRELKKHAFWKARPDINLNI